jgi:nitrogen fixation NifU-like protein
MNLKELYQEIILEHGKNPRNLRKTENFNKDAKVTIHCVVITYTYT